MKSTLGTLLGIVVLIIGVAVISAHLFPPPIAAVTKSAATVAATAPATAAAENQDDAAPVPSNGVDSVQGDAARAKRIVMACWSWAQSHGQRTPDDLATLVAAKMLTPADLVAARTGTPPLSLSPGALAAAAKDHRAFSDLLEPHCDYVYLGQGLGPDELKQNAITQQVVILYEKPSAKLQGRMNLGFIDGHIQIRLISRLPYALRPSNDFFARTHRPLIDIAALQEAATK